MKNFIKSPLNYTGNKFRILDQIYDYIPRDTQTFLDVFCGGATVGINSNSKETIMVDSNPFVVNLLKALSSNSFDKIIREIEDLIEKHNLTYSKRDGFSKYKNLSKVHNNGLKEFNHKGYYTLRDEYNNSADKECFKSQIMLYLLIIYGFNNDIRFNSKGDFNLPVGKTDFNKNNYDKILEFNKKSFERKFVFFCTSFENNDLLPFIMKADFVYMDPPYLVTNAFYNENNSWSEIHEKKLIELLDFLLETRKPFGLSNILTRGEVTNKILNNWIKSNVDKLKIVDIDINYINSSYNKKKRYSEDREILVLGGI